mmetsp:Transcript_51276/g.121846  ORF Transcript_51276/g.121846 Transcript_51276/m.121846 type:complete len:337 (-) Transcript_51276:15-1025(-)
MAESASEETAAAAAAVTEETSAAAASASASSEAEAAPHSDAAEEAEATPAEPGAAADDVPAEKDGKTSADAADKSAETSSGDPLEVAMAAATAEKAAGNDSLKAADLPTAIEHYEKAIAKVDEAMGYVPQTKKALKQNDLVRYNGNRFGHVDTADMIFGDYILKDLGTKGTVTERLGYQDVEIRFKRKEIESIPQEMYDLRLACLQNITLVALKIARASHRHSDFEDVVAKANVALMMDGLNIKALIRKGAALLEMKDLMKAFNVLKLAYDKTYGKDVEVLQLLQVCLAAKGKGKGKGLKGKDGELLEPPFGAQDACQPCSPSTQAFGPQEEYDSD